MRSLQVALMATMIVMVQPPAFAAVEVSVAELVEKAGELAGEEVTVEGELVGDYGFRGDGWMWTQLNGDVYAREPLREGGQPAGSNSGIGIRMPVDMAVGLDSPGRYRQRGPLVRVTGTWKYHDPERQGESYLEVEELEVVEPGRYLGQDPDWIVILIGVVLLAAAGVLSAFRVRS